MSLLNSPDLPKLRLSPTGLELFRRSPAMYRDTYLTRIRKETPSPSQWFGITAHRVLLGGSLDKVRTTPRNRVLLAEMQAATRRHPHAQRLLTRGVHERAFDFPVIIQQQTYRARCRLDRVDLDTDPVAVVDLKTASTVARREFGLSCWRHGYHRQEAFYRLALRLFTPRPVQYFIVAIAKTFPATVVVCRLIPSVIDAATRELEQLMQELHQCLLTDHWPVHRSVPEEIPPAEMFDYWE